jgi:hypothetical protein
LKKVVELYFSILNDYFREAYKIASENGFVKNDYWNKMLKIYDPIAIPSIMDSLYEDLSKLDWDTQEQDIRRIGGFKASYTGSVYGYLQDISHTAHFLKKASLYADTIILNDSILSELWSWRKKGRIGWEISFPIVLSAAIDFLFLKELFLSDTETPVCSLAPALPWKLEKENRLNITDNIIHQTEVEIGSQVFGEKFSSYNDLTDYLSKIKSPEHFFFLAKDISILGDPNGAPISINAFQQYKSHFEKKYSRLFDVEEIYGSLLRSNFSMAIYDLAYHGKFNSVFGTDFKGVWKSLIWLMQNSNVYSSKEIKGKVASKHSFILQALQEENIRWLGNIPLTKIKEIREEGKLQDLRNLLGRNIETIEGVSDEEFFEVGQQVRYNIETAFKKHSREIKDLNDDYRKKYKLKTPSLIVSGALGITASVYPPVAIAASILGGSSVLSIIEDYQEKREKIKELQRKPVAMLFDARKVQQADQQKLKAKSAIT